MKYSLLYINMINRNVKLSPCVQDMNSLLKIYNFKNSNFVSHITQKTILVSTNPNIRYI